MRPAIIVAVTWLLGLGGVRASDRDTPALMASDARFDADVAARGVDAWVEWFAPNGVQGRGDRPPVVGHAAIRALMEKSLGQGATLRWKPKRAQVVVPGKLGTTTGRYEFRSKDAKGKPVKATGTYLTVWQKQADGTWKVIYDTGVPDPPAGE